MATQLDQLKALTTVVAEGMYVGIALLTPVGKLYPEFVARTGRAHKLLFVYAEGLVKKAQVRQRSFANANCAYGVGFHQLNCYAARNKKMGERRCCHPAAGASAEDNNGANTWISIVLNHSYVPLYLSGEKSAGEVSRLRKQDGLCNLKFDAFPYFYSFINTPF